MLKAVLFDLGETLVKTGDITDTLQRILETHGIKRTREDIAKAHDEAERLFGFEFMKTMSDEYWVKRNGIFLERLGVFDKEDLARFISERWWDYANPVLHVDAIETLERLRGRGLKMGIITNGLQTDIAKIMSKVDLDFGCFDVVVTVSTINSMKPEREIFQYALNTLNVAPSEALFVGDTIKYDYEGATKAGLKALLIDRYHRINGDFNKIHDLREILPLI